MDRAAYTYWQDEGMWLGYLNELPDYLTQAISLTELEANLLDLYKDLNGEQIPLVRRRGEIIIA